MTSMGEVMDEPLATEAVKRLIRDVLKGGRFTYSKHAKDEMLADDLTTVDCENVSPPLVERAKFTPPLEVA